jgi:hypothetical protein
MQTVAHSRRALTADTSHPDGRVESSVVVAEPAHILRLKGVVNVLQQMIEKNNDGSGMARMAFFMSTFTDELADELAELDELQVRLYMFQIGEVISWIGHGDNSRLPDAVQGFADLVNPTGVVHNGDTDTESSSHIELDSSTG